jgi:hypothetical protein
MNKKIISFSSDFWHEANSVKLTIKLAWPKSSEVHAAILNADSIHNSWQN